MVCQAAGKIRFRALKHENGIAGNATIIVRVIACFQPLQDCQAEYFRQLLKPVTFHLQHKMCQHMKANGVMNPNSSSPGSQSMCHEHTSPFKWMVNKAMQPRLVACKCTTLAFNLLFCPAGGQTDVAARKRFLVFDQSGDRTNLIISSVSPPACNLNQKPLASSGLYMNFLDNRSTNNHPIDRSDETSKSIGNGCDEMHEDTEEIDALLYSASEDEGETSTDHSPDKISANDEEVASSTVPTKRKRLVEEIDTALVDTASSEVRFHCYQNAGDIDKWNAVKHSCVQGVGNERDFSWAGGPNKRLKRERIQDTMCVLRRFIPGGKGKDTVAVLDKAIQYLRSLKAQTKN